MTKRLILGISGASGAYAAHVLLDRSPWPVMLVASRWARQIYAHECGPVENLLQKAAEVYDNDDMLAPIASGSVATAGMVILPCSAHTLGAIAAGMGDNLLTRAAHCQLKERRPLILCVREAPWTSIDLQNAARLADAGAIIMPISPPFFMFKGRPAEEITLHEIMTAFVDRVLSLLGHAAEATWEDVR